MVLAGFKTVSVISEADKKLVGQLTDCLPDFSQITLITMELKDLDIWGTESEDA